MELVGKCRGSRLWPVELRDRCCVCENDALGICAAGSPLSLLSSLLEVLPLRIVFSCCYDMIKTKKAFVSYSGFNGSKKKFLFYHFDICILQV